MTAHTETFGIFGFVVPEASFLSGECGKGAASEDRSLDFGLGEQGWHDFFVFLACLPPLSFRFRGEGKGDFVTEMHRHTVQGCWVFGDRDRQRPKTKGRVQYIVHKQMFSRIAFQSSLKGEVARRRGLHSLVSTGGEKAGGGRRRTGAKN